MTRSQGSDNLIPLEIEKLARLNRREVKRRQMANNEVAEDPQNRVPRLDDDGEPLLDVEGNQIFEDNRNKNVQEPRNNGQPQQ
ncbi:unnamed protein product [Arabis nemorensis]|uniref:Uncharacterized protein n=1 Tax=Arabis nemorensis TaxID=586526 RepID=A0A565CVG1_9BRAS|nr:unnamed protein product [Arabis nemorensis]